MKRFYDRYWQKTKKLDDFDYKWPVLKKLISAKGKVNLLDYGCGKGIIAQEIKKINPEIEIVGVDVSRVAINKAKDRVPGVKFKTIEENKPLPLKDKEFDFILAADVVEHVYDTQLLFSEFNRILKKGGKLLISVPYYGLFKNLIIALFAFDFVFDVCGPHIRFFTQKSLRKCLKEAGFKVEKFGFFGRFYPFSHGMYALVKKA